MTTARVPLIDETTGRFPDVYAPPSVAAAVTTVTEKASAAAASATEAAASATAAAASAAQASAATSSIAIAGTGSPYNVVTPTSAGVTYTDTLGTYGAWKWLSTGTTKTSWIVTTGDTGWRNLASEGPFNTWDLSSSGAYARIRRQGSTVMFAVYRAAMGSGWSNLFHLPQGFRAFTGRIRVPVMPDADNPPTPIVAYVAIDQTVMYVNFPLDSTTYMTTAEWVTDETWPTTLPGTAF